MYTGLHVIARDIYVVENVANARGLISRPCAHAEDNLNQQHCTTHVQQLQAHKKQHSGDVFNHTGLQNSIFY